MNILIASIHLFSLLLLLAQLTVLNTAGYEDTVLWSPYGNEGMGYNNFVCVESVKVRQSARSTPFSVSAFIDSPIQKTQYIQKYYFSFRGTHPSHCPLRLQCNFVLGFFLISKFDPVTLEGGSSWTGDMSLVAGDV